MAKCIKCDFHEPNFRLGGVCSHCGINRGWETSASTRGETGIFCIGCGKGAAALNCPKCGHSIVGNDLNDEPVGFIEAGLKLWFALMVFVFLIMAILML